VKPASLPQSEKIFTTISMAFIKQCDRCDQELRVPDDAQGKKIRCPICGDISVANQQGGVIQRRRRASIFENFDNQKQIAKIICAHYRARTDDVTYRINRHLDSDAMAIAKFALKKPFLTSWSAFIPEAALSNESVFEMFAGRIFFTSYHGVCGNNYWNGNGDYESQVKFSNLTTFTGFASLAFFGALVSPRVYTELEQYLELPPE
jgi:ribosomal protein S27E